LTSVPHFIMNHFEMLKSRISKRLFILIGSLSVLVVGIIIWNNNQTKKSNYSEAVKKITNSEELILSLQKDLNFFSKSAKNLNLPDWQTTHFFESNVSVRSLESESNIANDVELSVLTKEWKKSPDFKAVPHTNLNLLEELWDDFKFLKKCKLKIIRGDFLKESSFLTHVAISGSGQLKNKKWASFDGLIDIAWKQNNNGEWKIVTWDLQKLNSIEDVANQRLFVRVNKTALPDVEQRKKAEVSIHEELVKSMVLNGGCNPPGEKFEYAFSYESASATPAVSVVDLNGDGFDDFYLMPRWGNCQFFLNQRDGTFKECASQYGLDIMNHCNSAVFADFDNDGDKDVIIARSFERSLYLENIDGKFKDASDKVSSKLTAMATSVTATDYNRDGLLDVFITTYGTKALFQNFLADSQQAKLSNILKKGEYHRIFDAPGAPNVLLVNKGDGKFAVADESPQLEQWKTSLTSAWVDYDQDGDPDVYISNDFGPDALFRNDYPNGFTDVTQSEGHETMAGFGMGVTWGDYDLDGKQDLYISNMFSKAGIRITGQVDNIDPRFDDFNTGNRLYKQGDEEFDLTSGLKPPKHLVAKVGWSWGGQFADFDNNGYLDLYVPSGYFTAPDAVARGEDL